MREIFKSVDRLNKFPTDMDIDRFCLETHGLKGSLSYLGATELSAKARDLENASKNADMEYCVNNLSDFLTGLTYLSSELSEAFAESKKKRGSLVIPPELPVILNRMAEAFENYDSIVLEREALHLDELELTGAIKEEVERIKEAAMIMNSEVAIELIEGLISNHI